MYKPWSSAIWKGAPQPQLGELIQCDEYFANGLKTATLNACHWFLLVGFPNSFAPEREK